MTVSTVRVVIPLVLGALLAGCQCHDNEFVAVGAPAPLENDFGSWLSMDAAPDGNLAVTYYDKTRGAIGFAVGKPQDSGEVWWYHEEVDGYPDAQGLNPGDRGKFTSMKVDQQTGDVWASYYDVTNGALRVAHRTQGKWEEPVVADAGSGLHPDVGLWTSLALDADGHPVVAHHDADAGTLRISRFDGTAWTSAVAWTGQPYTDENGTRPAKVGEFARLLIDGNTEYIVFYDRGQQTLDLLEGFAGNYAHTTVYSDVDVGQWPSIAVSDGTVYIAFQDVAHQDLMLATRESGGAFSVQTVDDGDYRGADTEVFVHEGTVEIVYFDGHENDMMLARQDGSGWILERLGGAGIAVGYHNEVVHTPHGWWVASYDFTDRDIFARPL